MEETICELDDMDSELDSGGENPVDIGKLVVFRPKNGASCWDVCSRSLNAIAGNVKVLSTESGTGYTKSLAGEHNTKK